MTARVATLVLVPVVAFASRTIAQDGPEVVAIQLPKNLQIEDQLQIDVDADGRTDLVLACADRATGRRELRTYLRADRAPAFSSEPSSSPYEVERDVVAFTYADVDVRPGRELVLFTAERAVAVLPSEAGGVDYRPLFAHRLVWPAPDRDRVLALAAVVQDLDGDGLDDFVLPEPDGARVLQQHRESAQVRFAEPQLCTLPVRRNPLQTAGAAGGPARLGGNQLQFRFDLGERQAGDDLDRGPLVSVATRAAPIDLVDVDGDGRRDAIAVRNDSLWWWKFDEHGRPAATATAMSLPLPPDRLMLFDPAFDVQLADLDGDHRADLLLTTSARRNDEVEVRIDLFVQRPDDGPWADKPDGRLRLQTLARPPQLVDADGDGRLDLVAITVRTDLLRRLTSGGDGSLQAQLNIYRGDGTRFLLPAMLNQTLQLPAIKGPQRVFVQVLPGNADSAGALLWRTDAQVQLRPLLRDGKLLRLADAAWQVPIATSAQPRLSPSSHELLIVDDHELLHVRWR